MATSPTLGAARDDMRAVWIGNIRPELDAGRFPVKRVVGESFEVSADILREGHQALAAVIMYRTVKDVDVFTGIERRPAPSDGAFMLPVGSVLADLPLALLERKK